MSLERFPQPSRSISANGFVWKKNLQKRLFRKKAKSFWREKAKFGSDRRKIDFRRRRRRRRILIDAASIKSEAQRWGASSSEREEERERSLLYSSLIHPLSHSQCKPPSSSHTLRPTLPLLSLPPSLFLSCSSKWKLILNHSMITHISFLSTSPLRFSSPQQTDHCRGRGSSVCIASCYQLHWGGGTELTNDSSNPVRGTRW